jgi:LuxR family transcriptional regulator, maltose regulon positive regulatory protein
VALAKDSSYEGKLPDGTSSVEAGIALVQAGFGYDGVRAMVAAARRAEELEPEQTSPWAALIRFEVGSSLYCSGEISGVRKHLEEALRLTGEAQPVLRVSTLGVLSLVAADEAHLNEAESLAREARGVVKKFGLEGIPQTTWANIALGRVLAERGKVAEARIELESGLSVRQRFSFLSPWPTVLALLVLAPVHVARRDRVGARAVLAEAHAILEAFPDAGMFPELLERQERRLRMSKGREESLNGELTKRELDVLVLLADHLTTQQIGSNLYVTPNTIRTHIKSIYRKLEVHSRKKAVEQAHARELI